MLNAITTSFFLEKRNATTDYYTQIDLKPISKFGLVLGFGMASAGYPTEKVGHPGKHIYL